MKRMAPLWLLSCGEKAEILEIRGNNEISLGNGKGQITQVEDMGLRVGNIIEMLNNEGRSPLLVKVDESRIAIGRDIAKKIMVRRMT